MIAARLGLVGAAALGVLVLPSLGACQAKSEAGPGSAEGILASKGYSEATVYGGPSVVVKPLDDPANPYAGQYREWDEWIFKHAVRVPKAWNADYPKGLTSLAANVTPEGWLVPQLEYRRLLEEAFRDYTTDELFERHYSLWAEGEADPNLLEQLEQELFRIAASHYPRIPSWVVESPPKGTMLVPNGEVITRGLPGSGEDRSSWHDGKGDLYRYSGDGQLLVGPAGWFQIYLEEKGLPWPEGEFSNRPDGYIEFRDRVTGEVLSTWDYDATRITTGTAPVRDGHCFMMLTPPFLQEYYRIQQEYGVGLER